MGVVANHAPVLGQLAPIYTFVDIVGPKVVNWFSRAGARPFVPVR